MTENTCIFIPEYMTINGKTCPAGDSIPPHGDGSVFRLHYSSFRYFHV